MIAVIQRVNEAAVFADGSPTPCGRVGKGLFILLGVMQGDTIEDVRLLAEKIPKMRIFTDDGGKMNLSLLDVSGGILTVSNFTLAANYVHGNRPDYLFAAPPAEARALYENFLSELRMRGIPVESGVFGADMKINAALDGPVTIPVDSLKLRKGDKRP